MEKTISQKTIVETKRLLERLAINFSDTLYERDFPAWFVMKVQHMHFHWMSILIALREGGFVFTESFGGPPDCIIPGRYLTEAQAEQLPYRVPTSRKSRDVGHPQIESL